MSTVRSRLVLRAVVALLAAVLAVALIGALPPSADAAPTWADADSATIHPGVQLYTDGAQCTANFVFHDATDVYLGYAAHCAGTGGSTDTNGCLAGSLPLGTPVEIDGASRNGTLAYSSWLAMQQAGEDPASDACRYNDFALVRLDPADHGRVNPTVPFWGGPSGLAASTTFGENVYSYQNSSLRLGLSPLSPKEGYSLGACCSGWSHQVYSATPGIPGDSGSGYLDSGGAAFGVLSTVALAPLTGSNGVSDLSHGLDYLRTHSALDVQLALGTEPFQPGLLP